MPKIVSTNIDTEGTRPENKNPDKPSAFARGAALMIEARAKAQLLSRAPQSVRADRVDHYIIHLQRESGWSGEARDRATEAGSGSVMVLDMSAPPTAIGADIDGINVIIPRDVLDALLPPFEMHGLVLHGAASELLRSYLVALVDNLPHIPSQHAPDLARATCSLVAACLAPSRENAARAQAPLAQSRLAEIRRYIDRHLTSRDLTPEAISKALGLSRSTLYTACEPAGGVAAMIQRRRLDRICAILSDPQHHGRISDVAYEHGFVSQAHFSRAFRRAFGRSPSEVREAALRQPRGGDAERSGDTCEIWIRQLGA